MFGKDGGDYLTGFKRYASLAVLVVFGVCLGSLTLSFAFNGLKLTSVIVSNYIFMCSMLISLTGALGMIAPFFALKRKLKKTPIGRDVEHEVKYAHLWKTLFISGIILLAISILMVTV